MRWKKTHTHGLYKAPLSKAPCPERQGRPACGGLIPQDSDERSLEDREEREPVNKNGSGTTAVCRSPSNCVRTHIRKLRCLNACFSIAGKLFARRTACLRAVRVKHALGLRAVARQARASGVPGYVTEVCVRRPLCLCSAARREFDFFFSVLAKTFNFCLMFDPEGDSDTTLLSLSASLRSLRSGLGNLCYRGASKVRRFWRRASAFAKANPARSFGQQKKRLKLSDLIASSITPTISSFSFSLAFFAARDNSTKSTHPLSLDSPRQWGTRTSRIDEESSQNQRMMMCGSSLAAGKAGYGGDVHASAELRARGGLRYPGR